MNTVTGYIPYKQGWYTVRGRTHFFRSGWEVNYARYLEFLRQKGKIKDWDFETKTFWFEQIKRGTRSYLPDFLVVNNDDSQEYHEVKGHMDQRSATKIKRMAKYYPNVKLVVIQKSEYREIMKFDRLYPSARRAKQPKGKTKRITNLDK